MPCEDPDALAGAVEELLRDDAGRRELGRRGRERVRTDFSEARIVSRYMDLYDDLIRRGRR